MYKTYRIEVDNEICNTPNDQN